MKPSWLKVILVSMIGLLIGFSAATFVLDWMNPTTVDTKSPWAAFERKLGQPRYATAAAAAAPVIMTGATVSKEGTAMRLASHFDGAKATTTNDGAIFLFIRDPKHVLQTTRRAIVAVEVSADAWDTGRQELQLQYIQNHLKVSGWVTLELRPGRHVYSFEYIPAQKAPDPRPLQERIDSVWLRSDARGRGNPVVVHEIRVYGE